MLYDIYYLESTGRVIYLETVTSKQKVEDKIISILSKYYVDFIYAVRLKDGKTFALAPSGKLMEIWKEEL